MDEGETFIEADERVRYEAATHGDVTITHAMRSTLRAIMHGWPWSAPPSMVITLVDAGLLVAVGDGSVDLSDEGRCLLAAHDRLADTRRVERPRLEPRPLPAGWRIDLASGVYVHEKYGPLLRLDAGPDVVEERIRIASDAIELYRWVQHSRAVEAQEAQR